MDSDEGLLERLDRLEKRATTTEQKQEKPWYRTPSIVISVLAFITSLTATIYSNLVARGNDIDGIRAQLRATLVQSAELGVKAFEFSSKFSSDPNSSVASQFMGAQNTILAKHAYYLVRKLGRDASTSDLLLVAYGLGTVNEFTLSENLAREAVSRAEGVTEKINAYRQVANQQYISGKTKEGKQTWSEAITFIRGQPSSAYINEELSLTYLLMSEALATKECNQANAPLSEAKSLAELFKSERGDNWWLPLRIKSLSDWLQANCSSEPPANTKLTKP
jgi:hypothetical protein